MMISLNKAVGIVGCAVFVSALHFTLGAKSDENIVLHMLFQKLYFLPILLGAVWYRFRGGLFTALLSSALYLFHLWFIWPRTQMDMVGHLGEIISFLLLGGVAGLLVVLECRANDRSVRNEKRGEREKVKAVIVSLSESLAARDPQTREHSRRVSKLAAEFASHLGMPTPQVKAIQIAGLLHDIGKIGIPDDILLKSDTLSGEERNRIMEHPLIGEKILSSIGFDGIVEIMATHHENIDGSGYPRGLAGESIPKAGRILAIADTYDALCSQRPYKPPIAEHQIREIMNGMAGNKLDPFLVEKFWEYEDSREVV